MLTLFYVQTGLCDVVAKTQSFVDLIPAANGQAVLVGGALVEIALRLFKTRKPLSVIHPVKKVVRLVANGLLKVCDFLDAIIPERVEGQSLVGKQPKA